MLGEYRNSVQQFTVLLIVADGDPVPGGGTFNLSSVNPNGLLDTGDVVFWSLVSGGGASGIYRFSSSTPSQFTKVVADGDSAPPSIGGTYIGTGIGPSALSGNRLVFHSFISSGSIADGIFLKQNIAQSSLSDILVVAKPGQATETSVGGSFWSSNAFTQQWPQLRGDGGILFHARLDSATTTEGIATEDGIFLWTGQEVIKIVVENDRLPNGQHISGVSSFIANDVGQVFYFAAKIL